MEEGRGKQLPEPFGEEERREREDGRWKQVPESFGEDGRWIAEVPELPGVMAYGKTSAEAAGKAQALALRVLAERIEHGEEVPELLNISFLAA